MIVSTAHSEHNRFVTDASWEDYNRYLEAVGDRRIRVTFDGTMLELMTPSPRHEYLKTILHDLLVCAMEETDTDYVCGGNTTFKQALRKQGLEPDDCFWIASWREVGGGWEATGGPPPDLAIEVEVTSSVLDRISIYVALGVPELWRVSEAGAISIWELTDNGYQPRPSSRSLPTLPLELLKEHLGRAGDGSMMRQLKAFRQALRELLG